MSAGARAVAAARLRPKASTPSREAAVDPGAAAAYAQLQAAVTLKGRAARSKARESAQQAAGPAAAAEPAADTATDGRAAATSSESDQQPSSNTAPAAVPTSTPAEDASMDDDSSDQQPSSNTAPAAVPTSTPAEDASMDDDSSDQQPSAESAAAASSSRGPKRKGPSAADDEGAAPSAAAAASDDAPSNTPSKKQRSSTDTQSSPTSAAHGTSPGNSADVFMSQSADHDRSTLPHSDASHLQMDLSDSGPDWLANVRQYFFTQLPRDPHQLYSRFRTASAQRKSLEVRLYLQEGLLAVHWWICCNLPPASNSEDDTPDAFGKRCVEWGKKAVADSVNFRHDGQYCNTLWPVEKALANWLNGFRCFCSAKTARQQAGG
jgi:hypothetical protein